MTWDAPPRRGAICLSSAECNLGTWTHRFGEHGPGRTASWSRGGRTSEDPSSWNGLNCKVSSQVFTRSWCPQNHQKDATSKLQKWLEGLIAWIVLALKMLAYVYVFVNCVTSLLMAKGPSKQLQLGCWRLVILAAPVANWCQFDMGRICSVLNLEDLKIWMHVLIFICRGYYVTPRQKMVMCGLKFGPLKEPTGIEIMSLLTCGHSDDPSNYF